MKNKQVVVTTLAYFYSKEEIALILSILNHYHKRTMESFLIEQIRFLPSIISSTNSGLIDNKAFIYFTHF